MARGSAVDPDFAEYVRARQHVLLRAAYLVCGDAHLAEDLVQGALVKLADRWPRLRGEYPDAYVRRILYHDAVSAWRKRRHELVGLSTSEGGSSAWSHPAPAEAVADRVDLARALDQLTAKQRAVLVLRFFEDRSEHDTAAALGVSVGTVKSQTHTALARLREIVPGLDAAETLGPPRPDPMWPTRTGGAS
jgi:RNA polymerase sigma-70 factor (sigma-E family)